MRFGLAVLWAWLLLSLSPVAAPAFVTGEPADPLEQYQLEYKRTHLGPALGIDQGKVERLLQIEEKYRLQKRRTMKEAKAALARLQQALSQPQPSDEEVAALLEAMLRLRQEKLALEQKQLEEEKGLLTPVQQARYILLLMNLRQQLARETQKLRSAPQGLPLPAQPAPREVPVSRPTPNY